jgi:uncharacterized protein (DUF1501 family)
MLLNDLKERGLLATTTVVWMGEFGRTPRINPQAGRDHYPNAWSVVLGGMGRTMKPAQITDGLATTALCACSATRRIARSSPP